MPISEALAVVCESSCACTVRVSLATIEEYLAKIETRQGKALRKLATFARKQERFGPVLDVEDELRAVGLLARSLEKLPPDARERVLDFLVDRYGPRAQLRAVAGAHAPTDAESLRIAQERMRA